MISHPEAVCLFLCVCVQISRDSFLGPALRELVQNVRAWGRQDVIAEVGLVA
jgi:hypothetical protein